MAEKDRDYFETIKDNVRSEWEANRPRDWRDGIHILTDGWLEPLGTAPAWVLIGAAIIVVGLFML